MTKRVVTWHERGSKVIVDGNPPRGKKHLGYFDEENKFHYAKGIKEEDKDFFIQAMLTRLGGFI